MNSEIDGNGTGISSWFGARVINSSVSNNMGAGIDAPFTTLDQASILNNRGYGVIGRSINAEDSQIKGNAEGINLQSDYFFGAPVKNHTTKIQNTAIDQNIGPGMTLLGVH